MRILTGLFGTALLLMSCFVFLKIYQYSICTSNSLTKVSSNLKFSLSQNSSIKKSRICYFNVFNISNQKAKIMLSKQNVINLSFNLNEKFNGQK